MENHRVYVYCRVGTKEQLDLPESEERMSDIYEMEEQAEPEQTENTDAEEVPAWII